MLTAVEGYASGKAVNLVALLWRLHLQTRSTPPTNFTAVLTTEHRRARTTPQIALHSFSFRAGGDTDPEIERVLRGFAPMDGQGLDDATSAVQRGGKGACWSPTFRRLELVKFLRVLVYLP